MRNSGLKTNQFFQKRNTGCGAMNTIECMEVFVEVAKGLSFSKAAERLGTSRSAITKKIAWLEAEFETQLLNRNTKRVSLTESGAVLLQNADLLAHAVKNLKDLVRSPVQRPSGRIRIGSPPSFGAVHLAPAVQAFLRTYPEVQVSLLIDDGRGDLIAENMDLSLRIAPRLRNSNQIAYKIAMVPQLLVATRQYLDAHGRPRRPKDLEQHNCLIHQLKAATGHWQFTGADGELHSVHVRGDFNANLGEAILRLAKGHHGISMHPSYMVDEDIRNGSLEVLLPDYRCEALDIYAIVQSKRYQPFKVRLFVDHLRGWFQAQDWSREAARPSPDAAARSPGNAASTPMGGSGCAG
ncbi:LysR substrate-binding domain protein [Bordetella hinzii L60]|nr:LysR substrate-binding domain protein [Bordetella hinzii L60]